MENKLLNLTIKKWKETDIEPDLTKRDKLYHQVTILRELQRFAEQFGETALILFLDEVKEITHE